MPERPNSDRRRDSRGDSRSDSRGDFRTGGRSSTPRPASGTGRPPGPRPSRPAGARDDDRRGDSRGDSRGGDRDRAPRRDDSGSDSRGGDRDRAPRRYGAGAGRPAGPRRDDSRDGGRRSGPRREDFAPRGPKNEAERRREAVRSRGGGEVRKDREQTPVSREAETWVDEGRIEDDVRDAAEGAVRRALAPRRTVSARPKDEDELDPQTKADVAKVLEPVRANRLSGRLKAAQIALERERYSEAKRIAKSLTKELSGVAAVHEVIGLASYRMGQWRDATAALELARSIRLHIEDMPVLADCYRAQRRWSDVDAVWAELKELSPSPEVMAEGRMVAAGSLSDRGELKDAIELMLKVAAIPRRVHEYHLKQWYVLGDLYDKAGNVQKAREFFQRVALHDKEYADVSERLASY